MSAFICSDNHISVLVKWAAKHNVKFMRENPTSSNPVEGHEHEVFHILLAENYKSVNYRYDEKDEPEDTYDRMAPLMRSIEIAKLCHSLGYQSCEHPEWDDSRAKALLHCIEQAAIRSLPGYDEAPWSL